VAIIDASTSRGKFTLSTEYRDRSDIGELSSILSGNMEYDGI